MARGVEVSVYIYLAFQDYQKKKKDGSLTVEYINNSINDLVKNVIEEELSISSDIKYNKEIVDQLTNGKDFSQLARTPKEYILRTHVVNILKEYIDQVNQNTPIIYSDLSKFNLVLDTISISIGKQPERASILPEGNVLVISLLSALVTGMALIRIANQLLDNNRF